MENRYIYYAYEEDGKHKVVLDNGPIKWHESSRIILMIYETQMLIGKTDPNSTCVHFLRYLIKDDFSCCELLPVCLIGEPLRYVVPLRQPTLLEELDKLFNSRAKLLNFDAKATFIYLNEIVKHLDSLYCAYNVLIRHDIIRRDD